MILRVKSKGVTINGQNEKKYKIDNFADKIYNIYSDQSDSSWFLFQYFT
jgi:hypothetical protein